MERYNAALYVRLSREDGDKAESDSVMNQKSLLENYILRNQEFERKEIYIDDGWTGTNFHRPAFQRMMEDIKKGDITV